MKEPVEVEKIVEKVVKVPIDVEKIVERRESLKCLKL